MFIIAESFISETFSDEVYEEIIANCKLSTDGPFVAPGTYPDSDLIEIVVKSSEKLNMPVDEFLKKFGHYSFGKLAERHPNFLENYNHPKDFLLTIENVIHVEVRKLYHGTELPTFQYKEPNPRELIITYFSPRKLYALMEGLIDGVADHFGIATKQSHTIYEKDGNEFCDFHLVFAQVSEIDKLKTKLKAAEQKVLVLEEMIESRTRELYLANKILKTTNAELKQFAYVASHDLMEPLRTLGSFVELLETEYKGKLDDTANRYLHYIRGSSTRMMDLINGLLAYARLGRDIELVDIDCNVLLRDLVEDIDSMIAQRNAKIIIDNLPTLPAHETGLRHLFQNLLQNALKYSRPNVIPEIRISAIRKNNMWEFAINDNGIGIDANQHQSIFGIFQRLHNRDEYEGIGLGLAFCKKIVDLHGGEIHVDSTPGEGSTFFFTIPA